MSYTVIHAGLNDMHKPTDAAELLGQQGDIHRAAKASGFKLLGNSIVRNGDHFTNGFDDQNRPTDFKINGKPVSEQAYKAALGQQIWPMSG